MAIEDVEKFRGPWLNPVWYNSKRNGPFNFDMAEWLMHEDQPGYYYASKKDDHLWLYLFTDSNVAFEFKMRWGGR